MNQYITNVNFTRNSLVHIFLLPWSYFPACIWNSYDFDSFGWIPVSGVKRGSFGPEKNSGFSYLLISLKSAAPCFSSHHPVFSFCVLMDTGYDGQQFHAPVLEV